MLKKMIIPTVLIGLIIVVASLPGGEKDKAKSTPKSKPAAKPASEQDGVSGKVTVVSVTGTAQKLVASDGKESKWQPLVAGEMLDELTIIRTGLRTKVVLKFADRAEFTIQRATKIGISEFRTKGNLTKGRVGLKYGAIHAEVDSSKGPNDFKVDTPLATLSVRGTGGKISVTEGFLIIGTHGFWEVGANGRTRWVAKEEITNSRLDHFFDMFNKERMIFIVNARGLSKEEIEAVIQSHGRGRSGGLPPGGKKKFRRGKIASTQNSH